MNVFKIPQSTFTTKTVSSLDSTVSTKLTSRFIKRLILNGKKGAAARIFDASLELLKKNIEQYLEDSSGHARDCAPKAVSLGTTSFKKIQTLTLTERNNLYSLANLTKEEIFVTALRKAQP